jgi:hypothetical protein
MRCCVLEGTLKIAGDCPQNTDRDGRLTDTSQSKGSEAFKK